MNERIKELIKKATTLEVISGRGFDTTQYNYRFNEEKFAELIVAEMYVFMCNATDNDKPWPTFKEVKQHFGVEE